VVTGPPPGGVFPFELQLVSGVFGASPKIALKKRTSVPPCGMVEAGAAEGR
jgi:hypothetical protein